MIDFICDGLLELWEARVERESLLDFSPRIPLGTFSILLTNEKSLPTVGFEPGTFRFRSQRANHCATRFDFYRALHSWLRFTRVCYLNSPVAYWLSLKKLLYMLTLQVSQKNMYIFNKVSFNYNLYTYNQFLRWLFVKRNPLNRTYFLK